MNLKLNHETVQASTFSEESFLVETICRGFRGDLINLRNNDNNICSETQIDQN